LFALGSLPLGLRFVGGFGGLTDVDTPARRAKSVVDMPEAVTLDELDGHLFASKIFLTSSSSSRIRCPTRGKRQAAMLRSAQIYRYLM
jgi:hypothetical protein